MRSESNNKPNLRPIYILLLSILSIQLINMGVIEPKDLVKMMLSIITGIAIGKI